MDYLYLKNFRVFKDPVEFDLAPITILTGKNNSGKSSMIKAILLLADFLNTDNDQTVLDFNGSFSFKHRINSFGNAKSWGTNKKSFMVKFSQNNYKYEFIFSGEDQDSLSKLDLFSLVSLTMNERLTLKRVSKDSYDMSVPKRLFDYIARPKHINLFNEVDLLNEIGEIKEEIKKLNREKRLIEKQSNNSIKNISNERSERRPIEIRIDSRLFDILSEKQRLQTRVKLLRNQMESAQPEREGRKSYFQSTIEFENGDVDRSIASLIRKGLSQYFEEPKKGVDNSTSEDYRYLLAFYTSIKQMLNLSVDHLSPNRFHQSRLFAKQRNFSEINGVLFNYANNIPKAGTQSDLFLKKWISEFCLGKAVRVNVIEGHSCLAELKQDNDRWVNIADMGFGAGQLLTLLLSLTEIINRLTTRNYASALQKIRNRLILIEEPESNLHPMLQSKLVNLFNEVSEKYQVSFIIETHSEYLIRKTQVKVKELGKGHPFKVYYFDTENKAFEMRYREDGIFENDFGPGFFDESANLTFQLL